MIVQRFFPIATVSGKLREHFTLPQPVQCCERYGPFLKVRPAAGCNDQSCQLPKKMIVG